MGNYRHDWDCGAAAATSESAMKIITSSPNDIFPFTVSGAFPSIILKGKYDLLNTIGPNNLGLGPDPIEVTAMSASSFTFTTLAGHHRGAGQTITFETNSIGGHIRLIQYGTFNSLDPRQYAYNAGASYAWALQAHNLRVALGTVDTLPKTTVEGALDAVKSATYLKVF